MAKKKSIAIIGVSNFSLSVIKTLVDKKQQVTVFDYDEDKLNLHLSEYEYGVDVIVLDSTNKMALAKNGIKAYDVVIVGVGTNIEAGLMTVLNLIDLECENVIARARDEKHKRILTALGLSENQIILPDALAGNIVAARSMFNIDLDVDVQSIDEDFVSTTLSVANHNIFNKTILAAGLSTSKDFNIIQIRRKGKILLPDDYTELKENDDVVVFARTTVINELAEKIQGGSKDKKENNEELIIFEELENDNNKNNKTSNDKNKDDDLFDSTAADDLFDSIIFDDNINETIDVTNAEKNKKALKNK
ncbi:K+, Na+ uptake protein integral membrane subunit [Mesoplasma florum L1]|uniref:K+, Na+ uptake protein integral membrane subunit n=1 Tax=Mesoplasma florum (strain ATCC 33453 / NBRC 100688 / NCTC 11704 / L1) TaxID=265311 RepID=Q6F1V2_MESFL|nr:NAD-binding protein [Mesoplasma florum]AAT75521.1 K+, Na+ uptake protein integral membrane subunit [Mesoplasma florum L1]ATI73121.1 TrkA family potassium uptake protein [Mesoplasma florum]ATI73808.1 TrkA family potassium uptake protein [Mesoplasma florum]AVN58775.1 potassium transporter TrkA [Mesoplasma florum]AVN60846.1 potassium transporter TrkA [Mesoplasma florum]